MNSEQLRAMANYMIAFYGAQAFLTAVERAKALRSVGDVDISQEWEQIAVQVSEIETAAALSRTMTRHVPAA